MGANHRMKLARLGPSDLSPQRQPTVARSLVRPRLGLQLLRGHYTPCVIPVITDEVRMPGRAKPRSPTQQLRGSIQPFDPPVQRLIRATRSALRKAYPAAHELVYDGYNYLAIGFCSAPHASSCLASVAAHAKGVSISFYHGSRLPDPTHRLEGTGKQHRFVRVTSPAVLKERVVQQLLWAAAADVSPPLATAGKGELVIKSVASKRRSRSAV